MHIRELKTRETMTRAKKEAHSLIATLANRFQDRRRCASVPLVLASVSLDK